MFNQPFDDNDQPITVGTRYSVTLDDCCVAGHFVSTLTGFVLDTDDEAFIDTLGFENGVCLTEWNGVTFRVTPKEE